MHHEQQIHSTFKSSDELHSILDDNRRYVNWDFYYRNVNRDEKLSEVIQKKKEMIKRKIHEHIIIWIV